MIKQPLLPMSAWALRPVINSHPAGLLTCTVRLDQVTATADERSSLIRSYSRDVPQGSKSSPPDGYCAPLLVWCVEANNPDEPDRLNAVVQLGAFDTEQAAQQLLADAPARYTWATGFRINVVPVHRSVEDWLYDR